MLHHGSTATLGRLTTPHWEGYTAPSPNLSLVERSQIVFKVSRSNFPTQALLEIARNFYPELLSSFNSRKRNFLSLQPSGIGTLVVSDSRIFAFWAPAFKSFSFPLDCRFETLGSYNSCRDHKLKREKSSVSNGIVGKFMEFNSSIFMNYSNICKLSSAVPPYPEKHGF
jgi:hypothetical protein